MENLTRIQYNLRHGYYAQNPHDAAEDRAILAGEFSWLCGQLERVLVRKPGVWNLIRPDYKSDTACERAYQQTRDGIDEMGLKLRLKGCEKMITALNTIIRLAEMDAKNQI
jgi:hypothetical protein